MAENQNISESGLEDDPRVKFWEEWLDQKTKTEIARMIAQKEKESEHDPLTGLYNRKGWDNMAQRITGEADRTGQPISLLLVDIDHFKDLNDTYGHLAGDQALIFIATVLEQNIRPGDVAARLGGDEFGLILKSADLSVAREARKRISNIMAGSLEEMSEGDPLYEKNLTISIGVNEKKPGENLLASLEKADQDMYNVKRGEINE